MLNSMLKNYLFLFLTIPSYFVSQKKNREPLKSSPTSMSFKSGAFIDINAPSYIPTNYNIDDLVKKILISGGSDCFIPNVSNVVVSPNQAVSNVNRSWGYFHKGTTNFPFKDGIVITNGRAAPGGNSFQSSVSYGMFGGGDADLQAAINTSVPTRDAVFIEFDFVPNNSQLKFNYLFASREYNANYPCGNYTDGFALLIKKVGDPTYTNMAVLPGGAGPVSIKNIIPSSYSCGPVNEQYFEGLNTGMIETNYRGRTVPLTASATVIPGETYHFKMVVADVGDWFEDSAVFIEGGSFEIGLGIVDENGNTLPAVIDICDNVPKELKAEGATNVPGSSIQWFFNGNPIPGANSISYMGSQAGVYEVNTYVSGTKCQSASIRVNTVSGIYSNLQGGQICKGDSMMLDAGMGTNYTYLWNTGQTTQTITVNTPGNYSVTINNGICSKTFTANVIEALIPEITKVDYNNGIMTITTTNPSNGELEYSIDNGFTWQSSNVFTGVIKNTLIPVRARVKNTSCEGFLEYYTFVMQNIITPNGDGRNDVVDFSGISNNKNFNAVIFNRYGQEIFKASKDETIWNGFYLGSPLPTSSYWFQINYDDPVSKYNVLKTGWILLKNRE